MQWVWCILALNVILAITSICSVYNTQKFKQQSYAKRLIGFISLSLFGLFICVLVLLDWGNKNEIS